MHFLSHLIGVAKICNSDFEPSKSKKLKGDSCLDFKGACETFFLYVREKEREREEERAEIDRGRERSTCSLFNIYVFDSLISWSSCFGIFCEFCFVTMSVCFVTLRMS